MPAPFLGLRKMYPGLLSGVNSADHHLFSKHNGFNWGVECKGYHFSNPVYKYQKQFY